MTSWGSTWRMFSAVNSRLMASASPWARVAETRTCSFVFATSMVSVVSVFWLAITETLVVNGENPTKDTAMVYVPGARS
jgi:hypothetical protein